jgi:F0F1-type ATP synthase assembly protein I
MPNNTSNKGLNYTGIGFQMLATISLCTWLGWQYDASYSKKFPIGILIGSLLGVGIGLYVVIKDVTKK